METAPKLRGCLVPILLVHDSLGKGLHFMSLMMTEAFQSTQLQTEIRVRTGGRVRNLRVYRTKDSLVLTGMSGTFYAKQLAQHAARELDPSVRLINDIIVGPAD